MLYSLWESVNKICIQNCLRKAEFILKDVKYDSSSSKGLLLLDEELCLEEIIFTNLQKFTLIYFLFY